MTTLATLRLGPVLLLLLVVLLLSCPAAVRCCPPSVPSSTASSAAHTPDNTFTQADSTISVSTSSRFFLQLPSNPSTGFSWSWTEGGSDCAEGGLLQLLSCAYQPAPHAAGLVGAGGFELWELVSGPHAGQEELQLTYSRPWEQQTQQQPTASWTLTVTEAEAEAGGRTL
jgi:inhibitor of cysteine peptidase